MTQLTNEQAERLKQIRGRLAKYREEVDKYRGLQWADGTSLRYYEAPDDVELLLSLLDSDSQAAGCTRPTGWITAKVRSDNPAVVDIVFESPECAVAFIDGVEPMVGPIVAATSMRDKCVEKVKALARAHRLFVQTTEGATSELQKIRAEECDIITNALESLTLDQVEQEKL